MEVEAGDKSAFSPRGCRGTGLFGKRTTYLAKIAIVLHDAPGNMLTVSELMDRMMSDDHRPAENNIRVCLSTHSCFVKIPVVDSSGRKKNYWKIDYNQITAKMVRRHFKGLLKLFPELAPKAEELRPPSPTVQVRCEVKFSSPFSIESLLQREPGPPARPPGAEPLGALRPAQAPAGCFPALSAEGARAHHGQAAFPVYVSSFFAYSLPAFMPETLRF